MAYPIAQSRRSDAICWGPVVENSWTILHAGALGDLTLTLQLACRLPGVERASRLTLISRADPGDLSAARPAVVRYSAEGLPLDWLHADDDRPPPARLLELLRGAKVLSALGDTRSVVHQRLLELEPAVLYSFDPRPRPGIARHIVAQWCDALRQQGLHLVRSEDELLQCEAVIGELRSRDNGAPPIEVAPATREYGRALLARSLPELDGARAVVLLHPGSGGKRKCWPLGGFEHVARALADAGCATCFVIGPVERECWPEQRIARLRDDFALLDCTDCDDLLAALAACVLLISNDSGPAHLAALIGTATLTIFGPTSPRLWRPLGPRARVLAGDPSSGLADWGVAPEVVVRDALLSLTG